MNQHAFALAQLGDAMDQLIRSGVVENETDRFGGIESGGNLHEFGFRQHDVTRISPGYGDRGDQITGLPSRNAGAAGVHDADNIVAGRIGQWWDAGIKSAAHQHVGERNSAGKDADAEFVRARIGNVVLDHFENFRSAESGEDDASVSHCRPS